MWKSLNYKCNKCEISETVLVDDEKPIPESEPCPYCEGERFKCFPSPRVLTASWPDGKHKDAKTDGLRMAAKLEGEKGSTRDPAKRAELQKEINRLKTVK
jgi:hypothetical protein